MAGTTYHIYRLGQLFPPNDEYAATVHEIRKAVHHLQTQQEFKDALSI
jgi:hypothetical protein